MDYEFDAPKFYDFDQPDMYEDAYNDDWFDNRLEDDLPLAPEQSTRKTGKPYKADSPCKPQRVLKPQSSVQNIHANQKSSSDCYLSSTNTGSQQPSPTKIQRLSKEGKSSLDNKSNSKQSDIASSPSPNTRLRKRISGGNASESPFTARNLKKSPIVPKLSEPVVPKHSKQDLVSENIQKSPEVKYSSSSRTPKSPLRRSPRKHVKSPFKAPKYHESPRAKKLASKSKFASMNNLHKANISRELPSSRGTSPQMKRSVSTASLKGKTSEELELAKIAEMKKDLALTRKQAQDSYKKAMKSSAYMPIRSNQPATMPEGFHFKTDGRLKSQSSLKDVKVKDFTRTLREALPQSNLPNKPQINGLTKPQPFKLSSAKSTSNIQSSKFKSDAEKVIAFHNATPERFRSKPKASKPIGRSGSFSRVEGSKRGHSPAGLTVAKTPTLTTRGRNRPARHIPTQEEKDQMEWEEHQKQQFKANPVNTKILEKATGVHKKVPKPLTVPEEFDIYHRHAVSSSDLRLKHEEAQHEFHAKPVDPRILQGPIGVKPVESLPVTVPESPAFALKHRVRIPVEFPKKEETKGPVKVHPAPHPGVPFRPKLEKQFTVPEPFKVEERSKQMLTRKDHKIQQVLEDEKRAREFHASGYTTTQDCLPPKQERPITEPRPFHLSADDRGQQYKEEFFSKVEEEERQAKEAARFRARPCGVTKADPFLPQKSNKPLTEISDFHLNTDMRVNQREAFDQHIKAKEAELEGLKRQREERIERERQEEIARMRQQAVHHAQGVKKYKAVVVKPSDKPLTDAHSPHFSQRLRDRNTHL